MEGFDIFTMNAKDAKRNQDVKGEDETRPNAGADQESADDKTDDLALKLQEAEKKAAENYDKYLRSVAEFDNYRKRSIREKADAINYGNEKLLQDFLPLLDGIDRALEQSDKVGDIESFKTGLRMIRDQFFAVLKKNGVESIEALQKDFDPNLHEAMLQIDSPDHEHNKVVNEFEKGFLLNGRLLRPAKVSVCKRPSSGDGIKNDCGDA